MQSALSGELWSRLFRGATPVVVASGLLSAGAMTSTPPADCGVIFIGATTRDAAGLADDGDDLSNAPGVEYPTPANPNGRIARDGPTLAFSAPKFEDELETEIQPATSPMATRLPVTRARAAAETDFVVAEDTVCALRIDSFARVVALVGATAEYSVEAQVLEGDSTIAKASGTYDFANERPPGSGIDIRRNGTPLSIAVRNGSRFPVNGTNSDRSVPPSFPLDADSQYRLVFTLYSEGQALGAPPDGLSAAGTLEVEAKALFFTIF